ncbi:MAG: ABC transporter substrate-binding protein [Planctomycetia bacterium]|nr:ABC transporter substrate-binding protein [Planctomycetia bacterium]
MKNKRNINITILFLILFIFNISCSTNQNQRIISLSPSHTEVLYALGLQEQIVGWTKYCNYPPEIQETGGWLPYDEYEFKSIQDELYNKDVAVVSAFTTVNYELIDSLKPTLILAVHKMQFTIAQKLREKGYNVLYFNPETLEDVFELIQQVGDATGKTRRAKKLITGYKSEINVIKSITTNLPKVKVYFEINHKGPWALGSGSPMDQILDIAGGENIFHDIRSEAFKAELNDIVERNPDVIFTPLWPHAGRNEVTTVKEIVNRPGFDKINAVMNDRVYHYDSSLLKKPGPRQVTAIKKIAHLLHPYYFDNPENSVDPWELGKIDALYPPPTIPY